MGYLSKFKFKTYVGDSSKDNTTISNPALVTSAPTNSIFEKDDGTQFKKNTKGSWEKIPPAVVDLGSTYLKVTGGTITGNVTVNGTLTVTDFVETSSIRFKENVVPLQNAFETISQLQGVSYDWKVSGKKDIGFIAEEVEKVLPEIVDKTSEGEVEGMNYGRLTALLVEVVKSQQAQIDELKQQIK
jgi:hypothetical protein